MNTTLSLAACHQLMKAWNMLPHKYRADMINNQSMDASLQFDTTIVAFSAMLSVNGHSSTPEAVDVFLVESFQDERAYNVKTGLFIQFQDEAINDGFYKHLEYIAEHPNRH